MADKATSTSLYEEVVIAGFGGQGIILAGKLLSQTAMECGYEVTLMPSYGAEVRGGTANTMIVIADEPIACPIVDRPDSAIIMNKASLAKYAPRIREGGLLVVNTSLVDIEPDADESVTVLKVPAGDLAVELGSPRSANMVALGAYLRMRGYMTADDASRALPQVLAQRYHKLLPINVEALNRGAAYAAEHK